MKIWCSFATLRRQNVGFLYETYVMDCVKEGRIGTESCEICSKPSLVVVVLYVVLHETIKFWEFDAL